MRPIANWLPRLAAASRAAPSTSCATFGREVPDSSTCARNKMFFAMLPRSSTMNVWGGRPRLLRQELFLRNPFQQLCRNFVRRPVFHDASLPLLLWRRHAQIAQSVLRERCRFCLLQCRHHGAHVRHPNLWIVPRLGQIASRPSQQHRRPLALRNQVAPALDSLENFEGTVRLKRQLIDALKLIQNSQLLGDE